MRFAEWMKSQDSVELEQEVTAFLDQLKSQVMSSMQAQDGYVTFSFPRQAQVAEVPVLQAAWYIPDLHEGWEKEGGKGGVAFAHIQPYVNWTPDQARKFKRGLTNNIKHISREMGLLFEVETYIYLMDVGNLNPLGDKDNFWAIAERSRLIQEIKNKRVIRPDLADMIVEFVRLHASGPNANPPGMPNGMGYMILQKTNQLIGKKCQVDTVSFGGGVSVGKTSNRADVQVGCRRSMMGYTMKFGSEPTQQVLSSTFGRVFGMLSGNKKSVKGWLREIRAAGDEAKVETFLQKVYEVANPRFANNPKRFVNLLEYLTLGTGQETLPAMRYYTRNLGEPGWSGAFQMDFQTREGPGRKLAPRMDANPTVSLHVTPTYLKMTYQLPKGAGPRTWQGTSIEFWPQMDETVDVKITNLASVGGRGY
jgi:hypothetical protein